MLNDWLTRCWIILQSKIFFRPILHECLWARFPPPTIQYFPIPINTCIVENHIIRKNLKLPSNLDSFDWSRVPPLGGVHITYHELEENIIWTWTLFGLNENHEKNERILINLWKLIFITNIDDQCHVCIVEVLYIITHNFWNCMVTRILWVHSFGIINTMKVKPTHKGAWRSFVWQHNIFENKVLFSLSKFARV